MASPQTPFPSFDRLPLREGDPPNSAWGLWGRGEESALGSLNYLTNELVLKAIKEEVKTGERVGLKCVSTPAFNIQALIPVHLQFTPRPVQPTLTGTSGLRAEGH